MSSFQWFGISGGEAIVRHYLQGHVYRFRPSQAAGWSSPELSRIETGRTAWKHPDDFALTARETVRTHLHAWREAA